MIWVKDMLAATAVLGLIDDYALKNRSDIGLCMASNDR